ncbi:protein DpdF [Bacillus sp. X1(2014)]|uniref:protein DpdF n=1 Tax=Bacillus sp. X1(2014) TaxID=1565991 RepID=UPI0011A90630|nr:protein DpdF [Bacillus sp. X1(2014)]
MEKIYDLTQRVLLEEMDMDEGIEKLNHLLENADIRLQSTASCVKRLFRCLTQLYSNHKQTSIFDFAGHLRQFILMFQKKVQVSYALRDQLMRIADQVGLYVRSDGEVNTEYPEHLPDMEKIHEIYRLPERRVVNAPIGDGVLHHMAGFTNYRSEAQKVMVKACLNMEEGETLVAALPTGGGKSLVFLLPSFYETEGGTIVGSLRETAGTTIVVVPTVALALDQKMSAQKFFPNAREEKFHPQAYYGGMPIEEKQIILEGLREGSLPILYTNPESIVNGSLATVIEDAGWRGNITRFVIDEAHIVLDWGSHFRTDFQLLTVFQKRLLKATKGKLKTILLSATLTDDATSLLRHLFSHNDKYTEIRGDELRLEPTYFISESRSNPERYRKITQIIPYLPRPIILYVSKLEDARLWKVMLHEKGYKSIETFSGNTSDTERERIIRRWNNDEIDMIVATSAFGMGVDKRDIRTVIHCCLPESVNRYYQEVGRGGRDGFGSISLLNYVYEYDTAVQNNLTSQSVLTIDMLWDRWHAMFERRESSKKSDEFWLYMNSQHKGLSGESGKSNAAWNEAVCLMLARHGVIEILDTWYETGESFRRLLVKILHFSMVNDKEQFIHILGPDRDKERKSVNKNLRQIRKLVVDREEECVSEYFIDTYTYALEACGGCPSCRAQGIDIRYHRPKLSIPFTNQIMVANGELTGSLQEFSGGFQEIILKVNENQWNSEELVKVIQQLTDSNVSSMILPDENGLDLTEVVQKAPTGEGTINYTFLTAEELATYPLGLLKGSVAIFYRSDEKQNDRLFLWSRNFLARHPLGKVVHISVPDIMIPSEGKTLDSIIDNIAVDLHDFLERQDDMFISEFM